jgi:60S ribosome subunit biogenesis protein NIP7
MKVVSDFAQRFNVQVRFDKRLLVTRENRFFLVNQDVKRFLPVDFYYAGTYLGKVKGNRFFPSFELLALLAKQGAYSVTVNCKAAWLFICGRDVFESGILSTRGKPSRSGYVLVLNEYGECLGFGRFSRSANGVVVKNISDVGDFLRRER